MPPSSLPIFLTSVPMLLATVGMLAIGVAAFVLRRPAFPTGASWVAVSGAGLLALAAGGPMWDRPMAGEVAVMVDLSPSTRTADYRSREHLDRRIAALVGATPHRVYYFASDVTQHAPAGATLADMPAEQTVFHPPAGAAAVVLLSDGRFALPALAPPTYAVIDPLLESPGDAAVANLGVRSDRVVARVTNAGAVRSIALGGVLGVAREAVPGGGLTVARPLDPNATGITARLAPGDPWPENDQLTALTPPPDRAERWWVGSAPPNGGWRGLSPSQLPIDPAAYLAPAIIVLDDVAASDLSAVQQQRLMQYVHDLGGGLVLLGGERAFAAGGYPGTLLESLSPLASTPPQPTTHWILLADSSGSMAQTSGGLSLWHYATDAIVKLLPALPPDDLLTVGSFAEALTWWSSGKTVRQAVGVSLPPPDVGPHGPTNLQQALQDLAQSAASAVPKQLLLMTDADAQIDDPAGLARALKAKNVHVHLLAIGEGSGLPALQIIAGATGGTVVRQFDPQRWTDAAQRLMRSASPRLLGRGALPVKFEGELASLPARDASPWNRTWLKQSATQVATGWDAGQDVAAGAQWNVGEGRVLALAFSVNAGEIDALSAKVSRPPRDPRFRVTCEAESRLRVAVDATDGARYLNGLTVRLDLSAEAENVGAADGHAVPQVGPGRYALEVAAPRSPTFATVVVDGHRIERIAVAGRYAPEFDAIGNDHAALAELARRTGGQVIAPRQTWPIDFHWRRKPMSLAPLLAAAGAGTIAAALGWWKLRG